MTKLTGTEMARALRRIIDTSVQAGVIDKGGAELALSKAVIVGIAEIPSAEGRKLMLNTTIEWLRKVMEELEKQPGLLENYQLSDAQRAVLNAIANKEAASDEPAAAE